MRVIDLTLKDLRQMVRDWRAAVFLLGMPIAFTLMFGFAFGGRGGTGQDDPRLPVGFLDQDQEQLSAQVAALLAGSEVIRIEDEGSTGLEEKVAAGDLAAAVIVPAGYSEELLAGQTPQLILVVDPGSNAGIAIQGEVQIAATRLRSAVQAAEISSQVYDEQIGFSDQAARQSYFTERLSQSIAAWDDPPVSISSGIASIQEDESGDDSENAFAQSSPGMMAQFSVAGLMGAVTILVLERKTGAMRRLLTTNLSRTQILLGHYLAMVIMIFAQLVVLVIFGQLFLGLDYFSQPLATLVVIITASLFVAALGLFIGAVAKSEEQVIVLSLIPMFILAGFGGAWVPLEIMPEGFQQFARLTPLAWVMVGFQDIIIRGRGLEAVWLPALVLVGYGVVFFSLGVWRFRIE